jgi:hypothetical protein
MGFIKHYRAPKRINNYLYNLELNLCSKEDENWKLMRVATLAPVWPETIRQALNVA